MAGVRSTYGSPLYADHVPTAHAAVVERVLDAGAEVVGKTNLPEFAWSVLGQSELLGTCHNPARPGRTTGGSSSGSAAALAAGLCDLALGTDTGCSIRLPAAACDVVGLKPQWGRIPMGGVFPLCPTLDTVGPMARLGVGCCPALVGARRGARARAAPRRPHRRAAAPGPGDRRRPRDRAHGCRRDVGRRPGTARRQGRRVQRARRDGGQWPFFQYEARSRIAPLPRARRRVRAADARPSSRAAPPGDPTDAIDAATRADSRSGAATSPRSTST